MMLLFDIIGTAMAIPVICPGCAVPVIAGVAGAANGPKTLITGASIAAVAPFAWVMADSVRTKTMNWIHPSEMDVYKVDSVQEIVTSNHGLASPLRLRTARVFLIDDDLKPVLEEPLLAVPEHEFLSNVQRAGIMMVPTSSDGKWQWKVPTVKSGTYRLQYKSGWTIWNEEGSFESVSPPFKIIQN